MTELLVPNTAAAIEFLQAFSPSGPRHLVSIAEGTPLEAKSFAADEVEPMRTWIDERQGERNMYFHVNALKPGVRDTKASKQDISAAHFLHVDVDDVGALDRIRNFSPRPTAVVFSGGGYQAFWRLTEPSPDLERVERCNRKLAEELGGDNCHNIDRVMRLPGTVNVPNAKKRRAGRKEALAYVVAELTDWSRAYPLDAFQEAPIDTGSAPAALGSIPGHIDLASLPAGVSDELRAVIQHGDDLKAPRSGPQPHFASRSEAVFRVACELIKARVPAENIISILLDPEYGISVSVREKGPRARQYAERQVRNATDRVSTGWPDASKSGVPRPTYRNTVIALRRLGLAGENDLFHRRKALSGRVMQVFQGDLTDDMCAVIRQVVIDQYGFDPGRANIIDAANYLCVENSHHPVREYLHGLEWDGVTRLDTWLVDYLGAEDTPLNRAISRIVLIAAVRRIREPGVKFDTILVLEGPQGTGKSTALRSLAGADNFSDNDILTLEAKQQMEAMEGVWIYEIGELAGLNRSDIAKVKAFASRQVDHARPAYARFRESRPRETIFVGTTNEEAYLRDTTGNRRFWPVRTGQIDLIGLERDRDQLWAEAAEAEQSGESISLPPSLWAAATEQQDARLEEDPWLDALAQVKGQVANGKERITSHELLSAVLEIPLERQKGFHHRQIAAVMKRHGWDGPKRLKIGGRTVRGYERDLPGSRRSPRW